MSDANARAKLAAAVPPNVRAVCATLTAAGHEAVTVGGAVRDAILGRRPGDWDVASSARPDQVMDLFKRTIPTGIQHGTVTIVTGRGVESHVEVTTYRGEGTYTDARRPDHVRFGVPLIEDLARRDLRVNAMAYDPEGDRLIDPYAGQQDIADHLLRAVGPTGDVYTDAVARFSEDGLRVMRAVRFAAQLGIPLHADTERGIVPALPSLAKVSKERISDELDKLLRTPVPSLGLAGAERTGIIALVVPALADGFARWAAATQGDRREVVARWLARVDAADKHVRLAALLVELGDPDTNPRYRDLEVFERASVLLKALKFSNAEALTAALVASVARTVEIADLDAVDVRRQFAAITRDHAAGALAVWKAHAAALGISTPHAVTLGTQILAARDPLSAKELAVTGKQVIDALALEPGPLVGRLIAVLLDRVIAHPALNTPEQLLTLAQELELELAAPGTKS